MQSYNIWSGRERAKVVKIGQVSQGGTLSGHNEGKIHDTAFVKICQNCEKLSKIAELVKIDKC